MCTPVLWCTCGDWETAYGINKSLPPPLCGFQESELSASVASSLTHWVILLALIVLHLKENKRFKQKDWRESVGRGRACTENTAGLES